VLKPSLRVFRGISKVNPPGSSGFFQVLGTVRHRNAVEQAELTVAAALDPAVAGTAGRGVVTGFDPFRPLTNRDTLSARDFSMT
jgi:hypothetical protein